MKCRRQLYNTFRAECVFKRGSLASGQHPDRFWTFDQFSRSNSLLPRATRSASTRGVSFQQESAASPTVAFYLNDGPLETPVLFQSMFDVGQVEVLRAPQGTVRGISAPSGAITLTTRRPDLSEFGGFANVTATDLHGRNAQGAVNSPIIQDVLALRLAGVIDHTDFDGVRSVHNPLRFGRSRGKLHQ
jgi:iron complex outermembrane receptor protein